MRSFKTPLLEVILSLRPIPSWDFSRFPLQKGIVVKKLSENLQREANIEKIKVNPYVLALTVQGFKVKDRASSEIFVACNEIFLNLQSLSALKRELILHKIVRFSGTGDTFWPDAL